MLNKTEYNGVAIVVLPIGEDAEKAYAKRNGITTFRKLKEIVNSIYDELAKKLDGRWENHLSEMEIISRRNIENGNLRISLLDQMELDFHLEMMEEKAKAEKILTNVEIGYLF